MIREISVTNQRPFACVGFSNFWGWKAPRSVSSPECWGWESGSLWGRPSICSAVLGASHPCWSLPRQSPAPPPPARAAPPGAPHCVALGSIWPSFGSWPKFVNRAPTPHCRRTCSAGRPASPALMHAIYQEPSFLQHCRPYASGQMTFPRHPECIPQRTAKPTPGKLHV